MHSLDHEASFVADAASDLPTPAGAGIGRIGNDNATGEIQTALSAHRAAQAHCRALAEIRHQGRAVMRIVVSSIFVDDQDKALTFYTTTLGFVKKSDMLY